MPDQEQLTPAPIDVDIDVLRDAIRNEYAAVADEPTRGFHFHTGRPLTRIVGYQPEWLEGISETAVASFAGTGNPFSIGVLQPGERVVDVGCGAGIDSLIAARMVGPDGQVVGVDMTRAMLARARRAAEEGGASNVEFREGYMEALPVPDGWADVVISNGVLNLTPDKLKALGEMARVLEPTGRVQIGDITIDSLVPEASKQDIDLWTG
ncbi:MAG: methyltransferase domain-containing protein [Vicinamibacterales bacterium]|nr:methyltransferase domain-containing protein [Vicinamibacterales bacterium]HJN43381.1 methyltransferase domain-containing protein [Vicinamibacterales bacterium]